MCCSVCECVCGCVTVLRMRSSRTWTASWAVPTPAWRATTAREGRSVGVGVSVCCSVWECVCVRVCYCVKNEIIEDMDGKLGSPHAGLEG